MTRVGWASTSPPSSPSCAARRSSGPRALPPSPPPPSRGPCPASRARSRSPWRRSRWWARAPPLAPGASPVVRHAWRLQQEGRLAVSPGQMAELTGGGDETLFGFSVRELSAPDATSRVRAAERLKALAQPAAAPALATALHAETDAPVQVALLAAFAEVGTRAGRLGRLAAARLAACPRCASPRSRPCSRSRPMRPRPTWPRR